MRRGLLLGIVAWALATLLFRRFAHVLLGYDETTYAIMFVAGGILAALVAAVFVYYGCEPGKSLRFGMGLVIPGLILDSAVVLMFPTVFPYADPGMGGKFGALMLWGYGIILATILLFGPRLERRDATVTAEGVHFETRGVAGLITLDRPKALNALTADMAAAMLDQLAAWADDPAVARVVIRAVGERAFCAGGDIRNLYDWGRAGDARARAFYRTEYTLNTAIRRFPKPYIALIDGIVMGGGVGLSMHGSHRVGTEAVTFAMPETGIGLFPDVGATYVLPRMAGETGLYLGLTGARLKTPDAHQAGVLTHVCPRDRHPALTEALCGAGDTDAILADFCEAPAGATLPGQQAEIDRCFAGTSVEDILNRLASDGSAWATAQADTLAQKSPTSLKITFRQLRLGATLEFGDAMRTEFRIVSRVLQGHEFFEGVRAVIIDKDQAPRWQPDALDKVPASDIDAYFAPLDDELDV